MTIPRHIFRTLIRESLMLFVGIAGFTSVVLLDAWLIGLLGTQELVAVGFAGPVLIGCLNLLLALGTGLTAVVAPQLGLKQRIDSRIWLITGLAISVVLALAIWLSLDSLLNLMHAPVAIHELLEPYFQAWYIGLPAMGMLTVMISLLRSASLIREASISLGVLCLVNAVGDPVLMFSLDLGLPGAAWATNLGAGVAALVAMWFWRKKRPRHSGEQTPLSANLRQLATIAIPAAFLRVMLPVGQILMLRFLAQLVPDFAGAYGVGQRMDLWILMAPVALSSVAAPRIGQAWGQNDRTLQRQWIRGAEYLGAIYGLAMLILVQVLAPILASFWADDPTFHEHLLLYFRVMSWAFAAQASFQVIQNSFYAIQRPKQAVLWALIQWGTWLGLGWVVLHWPGNPGWVLAAWPLSLWGTALIARRSPELAG